MTTREQAESLVQELYDQACDGNVAEVLILSRAADGTLMCAFASDDLLGMVDAARDALADIENQIEPCSGALN